MRESHGKRNTPTYTSWRKMRERCYDPKNNRFYRYGGRGIKVCPAWRSSFSAFLADMGERPPGKTLERLEVDKDYEPGNCTWATPVEQSKDCQRLLTFKEKTQSVSDWARDLGVKQNTISMRLNRYGWSIERALSTGER